MNRSSSAYKLKKRNWLAKRELWPPGTYRCEKCGKITISPELDHIDNTGMGGSPSRLMDEKNWQLLCHDCHQKKTENKS